MDNKTAKQKLSELRDSLNEVLGSKSQGPSREDAEQALKLAKEGSKRAKKSLLGRIKDLPVIDKLSQLGAAGTVAVSTAAVTQTNIAVDQTEVFVASVANDVVEERLGFPAFVENIVNFDAVNVWGQGVMQAKVAEVRAEVAKAEAKVAPAQAASESTKESSSQENKSQNKAANSTQENKSNEKGAEKSEDTKQGKETAQGEEAKESTQEENNSSDESKEETQEENRKEESKQETRQEAKQETRQETGQEPKQSQQTKPSSVAQSMPSSQVLPIDPDIVTASPEGPGERQI
jgi:cobalamin biosynthesis protein CobT